METKRRALGKGLEELFNTEQIDINKVEEKIIESTPKNEIVDLDLDQLRSNPYQPRKTFDQNALEELAESIKNYGVFQPIIVKKSIKGYDLVAGERRVKASRLAGMKTIPAIVKDFSDEMMREIALLENLQRENLTSIELAWAYKGIIDTLHIRQEDLAVKLGKSRSHITNTLGLLRLPESVQNMVLNGSISMAHARELSKIEDDNFICEYANKIVNNNISVRELETITRGGDVKKKVPVVRKNKSDNYKYLERQVSEYFGTNVKIGNKKLIISFENDYDLNRILDIMGIKINE